MNPPINQTETADMNILIISTNRCQQPMAVMPYGACIIAEAAEQAGHSVTFLDLMFKTGSAAAATAAVKQSRPDVIGLSLRNIDNNDMQQPEAFYQEILPVTTAIRREIDCPIILGGAAMGVMPEDILRYTGLSLGVAGNGEIAFPQLIQALSENREPDDIPGVCQLKDGTFRNNPPARCDFSSDCPAPDLYRWLDVKAYRSRLSCAPLQTKRGCPFDCVYCTYAINEGRRYHLFSPESVVKAVGNLVSNGFRDIEFVDNVFNSPYDHALSICEKLADAQTKARLQSLELNPRFVNDELLNAMEKAGFVGIGITAESAADPVLKRLRKGFTAQDVRDAAGVIREHKLPCLWIFMLGGPGETEETVQETLDFAAEYIKPKDAAFFNIGIRVYPGTELERIARDDGSLRILDDNMLEPCFYLSPQITQERLAELLDESMEAHLNFMNSNSITSPLIPMVYKYGHRLGIRPPLWRHTAVIRQILRALGHKI